LRGNLEFRWVLHCQLIWQAADSPGGAAAFSPGRESGVMIADVHEAPEGRHRGSARNWRYLPLKRQSDVAPPGLGFFSAEILGLTPQAKLSDVAAPRLMGHVEIQRERWLVSSPICVETNAVQS
jgi:hypothetical protein